MVAEASGECEREHLPVVGVEAHAVRQAERLGPELQAAALLRQGEALADRRVDGLEAVASQVVALADATDHYLLEGREGPLRDTDVQLAQSASRGRGSAGAVQQPRQVPCSAASRVRPTAIANSLLLRLAFEGSPGVYFG